MLTVLKTSATKNRATSTKFYGKKIEPEQSCPISWEAWTSKRPEFRSSGWRGRASGARDRWEPRPPTSRPEKNIGLVIAASLLSAASTVKDSSPRKRARASSQSFVKWACLTYHFGWWCSKQTWSWLRRWFYWPLLASSPKVQSELNNELLITCVCDAGTPLSIMQIFFMPYTSAALGFPGQKGRHRTMSK